MRFTLKLESPLCPAIGEGTAGIIDTEVATDEFGIPEIPAKRFKGCLLECFDELAQWDQNTYTQEIRDRIFGKRGERQGILYISNGHPEGYHDLVKALGNLQHTGKETATYFRPEAVRSHYTVVRSQTAMNRATGVAKDNSLRTISAIKPDLTFKFEVFLTGDYSERDITVIENCAKVLRHMGLNRTRGLGLVSCSFDRSKENELSGDETSLNGNPDGFGKSKADDNEADCLVNLILESSVILKEGYITGTSLMGTFAALYIREKRKSDNTYNPISDKIFREIFLNGGVRFQNGYPVCGKERKQRSEPNSAGFIVKKDDNKSVYVPEGYNYKSIEPDVQRATISRGFNIIFPAALPEILFAGKSTELNYHHERPDDKSIGHALGEEDSSKGEQRGRGQFFTYEAIPVNSEFIAIFTGKREYLELLRTLAGRNGNLLRIGRSTTAQYGSVRVQFGAETGKNRIKTEKVNGGGRFGVFLTAPAVIPNEKGYCDCSMDTFTTAYLRELKKISPSCEIELQAQYCRFSEYSGFNVQWKLPKVTRPAYDGGSLFVFENKGREAIQIPAEGILGLHTNVGYGTYRIDRLEYTELIVMKDKEKVQEVQQPVGTAKPLVTALLDEALYRELSREGFEKAEQDYKTCYSFIAQRKSVIWQLISKYSECHSEKDYSKLETFIRKEADDKEQEIYIRIQAEFPMVKEIMARAEEISNRPFIKERRKEKLDEKRCTKEYYDAYFNQLKYKLKRAGGGAE